MVNATDFSRLVATIADRYRIERELGAGGMATVYLARDLKHDRAVALKVLRRELAAVIGAERFLREIKTIASLQHPHILGLIDSGEVDGTAYYVMPFVEGESLRDRLGRDKQLPTEDAVRIAREIASALDYAHRHGVIHRDIKPENIMLHDGSPMVMDFGIALAVTAAGGTRMTETGMSLGTPQYMSPEQAMGEREITARADVYALGALTYELLVGEPPFTGPTAQAIIARVLTTEPVAPSTHRRTVPPHIDAAVLTALEKVPADRFANARAFGDALANPSFAMTHNSTARPRMVVGGWRQRLAVPLLVLAAAATAFGAWAWLRPAPQRLARRQLVVDVPRLSRTDAPVLSPIGDRIAFIGDGRLWIRALGDRESRPLVGTEDARAPFWSPDGLQIGYFVGSRVFRIPASGGAATEVTSIDFACPLDNVCGGSWTDDGSILLSSGFKELLVVSEAGGVAKPYLMPAAREHFHSVAALPNGRGAMFEVDPDVGPDRIDVWDGHARRTLVAKGAFPRYAAPGYLVFSRGDAIWALRIAGTNAVGDPFPIVDHASYPSASNAGSLVFKAAGGYEETLIWVDRGGAMREAVGGSGDAVVRNPALSPGETQIAFDGAAGIRVEALGRGARVALGVTDSIQHQPAWASGENRIFYVSSRTGGRDQEDDMIRMAGLDGGAPVTMADSGFDPAITTDGRYFTYTTGNVSNQSLWYRDLRTPGSVAKLFLNSPSFGGSLRLSPDNRYAAFVAGDWKTGAFEIYLSRFPGGEDRTQVSIGGVRYTSRVYWSAAGNQLYYVRESDGALMVTDVAPGAEIRLSTPRVLFTESVADLSLGAGLAVSKNPGRFLAVRRTVRHGGAPSAFVLLDDWRSGKPLAVAP